MSFWNKLFGTKDQSPAQPSRPTTKAPNVSSAPPPKTSTKSTPPSTKDDSGYCRVCRRRFNLQDLSVVKGNAGTYICRSCNSKVDLTELKF
jgi:hypothetical protein